MHFSQTSGRIGLALAAALVASAAGAAPLVPALDDGSGGATVILVRGGCGFGEHRGPFGGCRINDGPRGRIRAAVTGLPRGCRPGKHRAPNGLCYF